MAVIFSYFFYVSAQEFLYRNQWGGISLLNAVNLSERVLMSNITFVSSLSAFCIPQKAKEI